MAAAEYYNPGGVPPQAPAGVPGPPPGPPPPQLQVPPASQQPPYPMSDAPPPYQAYPQQQRPQSQPPPMRQNGPPQYTAYNPNQQQPPNINTHQYPPEKVPQQRPSTLQNMYRPSDYATTHPPPQGAPQQQSNGYFTPAGPALSNIYNDQQRPQRSSSASAYPAAQSPYRRDSRSHSRERRKHRHNNVARPQTTRQKSTGVNTFLGAGGGAIIGDLIFPGLGTIGGALIGGVGGHEYGKKRASSNPSRTNQQRRSASNYGEYSDDEQRRRGRKY